jgi:hypothetical protein
MSDVNTIFILKLLCIGGLGVGVIYDNLSMLMSRVFKKFYFGYSVLELISEILGQKNTVIFVNLEL